MSIEASSVVLLEGAAGRLADDVDEEGQPVEVEWQVGSGGGGSQEATSVGALFSLFLVRLFAGLHVLGLSLGLGGCLSLLVSLLTRRWRRMPPHRRAAHSRKLLERFRHDSRSSASWRQSSVP